jgi:hypothetical protein
MTKQKKAIPYILVVKQFAIARNLRFFTWAEMVVAIQLYEAEAVRLN